MTKKRVLLADDHPMMLAGLASVLAPKYDIIGTCQNGRQLVAAALRLNPDLIILDIGMPELNGVEAARQILADQPNVPLIFITEQLNSDYIRTAFAVGARAYVAKHAALTELFEALDAIAQGNFYVTPQAAANEPELFALRNQAANPAEFFGGHLTPRQREVLQLIAEGSSAKEISVALAISTKTVEFHKRSLMDQLGVRTTAELTRYAIANGISQG